MFGIQRSRPQSKAAVDPADGVGRYIIPPVSTAAAAAAAASEAAGACVGAAARLLCHQTRT